MGKIYVIQQGCYSEKRVVCATINKELAKAYIKLHNAGLDEYDEYWMVEVDDLQDNTIISDLNDAKQYYTFYFDRKGNIIKKKTISGKFNEKYGTLENLEGSFDGYDDDCFIIDIICDDYNRALKIARDKRSKALAEKYGL